MKLKKGSYNVRLEVDANGKIELGFAHKCYKVRGGYEWKDIPNSVRVALAKLLTQRIKGISSGR